MPFPALKDRAKVTPPLRGESVANATMHKIPSCATSEGPFVQTRDRRYAGKSKHSLTGSHVTVRLRRSRGQGVSRCNQIAPLGQGAGGRLAAVRIPGRSLYLLPVESGAFCTHNAQ